MKLPFVLIACLTPIVTCAQETGGAPTVPAPPPPSPVDIEGRNVVRTYTVRVAASDGGPIEGVKATAASGSNCVVEFFREGTITFRFPSERQMDGLRQSGTDYSCWVTLQMPGFRSVSQSLADGQKIVLQRLGDSEGSTISFTILNASKDSQKAHNKGLLALRQQKWTTAQKQFEEAVRLYPKHAAAWSELASVLERQGKIEQALSARRQATVADPRYIRPYEQMARMEAGHRRWPQVIESFERAMPLNPVEFPGLFYYDAVALYNLGKLSNAEKSAQRSAELDTRNEFPRAWLLLGQVLMRQKESRRASEALQEYLRRSPKAPETVDVEGWIAKLDARR